MSTLRCKPGDLAVIVRSEAGNEGKIVKCVRFVGHVEFFTGSNDPAWEVDRELPTVHPAQKHAIVLDANLRPIRPDEGADQTIEWADLPAGTPVEETT